MLIIEHLVLLNGFFSPFIVLHYKYEKVFSLIEIPWITPITKHIINIKGV
jgi:hypothetical protein